uniref:Uncharacterized protein n=1 Tax=Haemonchus contortus TaxID=6289 RepID=A0A7I5ECB5_HAECO
MRLVSRAKRTRTATATNVNAIERKHTAFRHNNKDIIINFREPVDWHHSSESK